MSPLLRRGPLRVSPFLIVSLVALAAIAAVLFLSLSNAVEMEGLSRESDARYKQNVIDQSSSLSRVIFAANRILTLEPVPGENAETRLASELKAGTGLLSHAKYVTRIDDAFLKRILGQDPLMLYERSKGSDRDFEEGLGRLEGIVEAAAKAGTIAEKARLVDDLKAETRRFMGILETRSMAMVQMADYVYADSKARIAHLLHHSSNLVVWFSALFFAMAVSIGLYLRSLLRVQAELKLHREHPSELVDRQTAELMATNGQLRSEIVERAAVEELLRTTVREKETLLKEVYHRVKNNLAMVNGLVSLQAGKAPPDARAAFEGLEGRIAAISQIHEKLYRSADLERIDLEEYLEDLAQGLLSSLREEPGSIAVETRASGIKLSADVLIPLGLIATEIVTNAIKHGFRNRATGRITLGATMGTEGLGLVIGDDGEAPAKEDIILDSPSLGALLIQELCGQLKGRFEISLEGGTSFHFFFPSISP